LTHPPRPGFHLAVGITGHRPPILNAAAAERMRPRLDALFAMLGEAARAVHAGHDRFFADAAPVLRVVTPLAEGADQLATEVALSQGFAAQAVLPLPRDDYRGDFVDPQSQAAFDGLIARMSCVLQLPPLPAGRDDAYALAGRATIAHSDLIVAIWDGQPARGRGGTAEVVAGALRRGLPVVHLPIEESQPTRILWSDYALFVDDDNPAAVPARPLSPDGLVELLTALLAPPAEPRERAFIQRFLTEREWRVRPRVEYPLLQAALGVKPLRRGAFRSGRYADHTREEWRAFREACADGRHGVVPALDPIEAAFGWADRLAQHFAQSYRSGHVLNFLLGAVAVLLGLAGLLLPSLKLWFAVAELAAIAGFVANTRVGVAREWHRRWLDYRQLAERLRPMRSLKLLGAAAPPARLEKDRPPRWLDWYAAAVWRASGCAPGRLAAIEPLLQFIVAEELHPQIAYHEAAARQMRVLDRRLQRIGTALFVATLLSCLLFVTGTLTAQEWVLANSDAFVALSAGLPALGAAIFGIRVQGEFDGSAERSATTAESLAEIVAALERDEIQLPRAVNLVEGAAATMFADLGQWRLAYHHRELEMPG